MQLQDLERTQASKDEVNWITAAFMAAFLIISAFLGPAIEIEVVLVLKANEVPPCVPGTIGATVGLTAWPRQDRAPHREDMEHTLEHAYAEGSS